MRSVTYRHSWVTDLNAEDEMADKFGKLLISYDTSEPYEQETSDLFINEKGLYTWIDSNGCSCWDGDYEGWELTYEELDALSQKTFDNKWTDRDQADYLVAKWARENIFDKDTSN